MATTGAQPPVEPSAEAAAPADVQAAPKRRGRPRKTTASVAAPIADAAPAAAAASSKSAESEQQQQPPGEAEPIPAPAKRGRKPKATAAAAPEAAAAAASAAAPAGAKGSRKGSKAAAAAAAAGAPAAAAAVTDDLPEMLLEADEQELAAATTAAAAGKSRKGSSKAQQQQQQQALQLQQAEQEWEQQQGVPVVDSLESMQEPDWEAIVARDKAAAGTADFDLSDEDEDDLFDFDDGNFAQLSQQFGTQQQKVPGSSPGSGSAAAGVEDPGLLGEYLFAADGDQPFDPEKGGYIRPRAGAGLDGGVRDDFDMFDLDLDFDGGMDDFFDSMGDPFGGSFMADFGAPGGQSDGFGPCGLWQQGCKNTCLIVCDWCHRPCMLKAGTALHMVEPIMCSWP